MRPTMKSELLQEIGEGCLFLGADGQIMRDYEKDPVALANRPTPHPKKLRIHKLFLARYNGTDICQWQGQGDDCMYRGYGRMMRILSGPAKPNPA